MERALARHELRHAPALASRNVEMVAAPTAPSSAKSSATHLPKRDLVLRVVLALPPSATSALPSTILGIHAYQVFRCYERFFSHIA